MPPTVSPDIPRVVKVQNHRFHTREVQPHKIFQTTPTIAQRHPHLGLIQTYLRTLLAYQRTHLRQRIQAADVPRSHLLATLGQRLEDTLTIRQRIEHHPHIRHPTLGSRAARPLLANTSGVDADVTHRASASIVEPTPRLLTPDSSALLEVFSNPIPHGFGGPLDGGFTETNICRFVQQFDALLETVGDSPAESREPFHGRGQAMSG